MNVALQAAWQSTLATIDQHLRRSGAHPARVVVLLPYAQLMPLAASLWAQARPSGFAPRFETTRNWARQIAPFVPGEHDLSLSAARDTLTARSLLDRAGLGGERDLLASALLEAASSLAGLAAAVAPAARQAWADQGQALLATSAESGPAQLEAAVARIAMAWVGASAYASDVLFEPRVAQGLDTVIMLQGFQAEPLTQALAAHWSDRPVLVLPLPQAGGPGFFGLHAATDAEDEAQRACACVLAHVQAGRTPVALVANDRALTRRIAAMLGSEHISVRDETGWKLSTTRAAASLMSALRACAWNASGDAVLDWLKNAPAFGAAEPAALSQTDGVLEPWLRKIGLREWREPAAMAALAGDARPELTQLLAHIGTLRSTLRAGRTLVQWLASLRSVLSDSGQWAALQNDSAGAKVLAELRLAEGAATELESLAVAQRRLSLAEFTVWVNEVLEAAHFTPTDDDPSDQAEAVVILPLAQLLGRPFAALVLPGCDELRLPPSPEPPGAWTRSQRQTLGLPTRQDLEAALRAAWACALQTPHGDLLWRGSDEGGEALLPSPLVQALQLDGRDPARALAPDPRPQRELQPNPTPRPQPSGQALPLRRLSASAYSDLRTCPYRFFALRQLGLQEADELEAEIDKRDFGLWLHAVLKTFHEALQRNPSADPAQRTAQLDLAAASATRAQALDEGEFLPFASVWPQVRSGYLAWLQESETQGAVFEAAEVWREHALGRLTLIGQIDRMDRMANGQRLLIDYKTEGRDSTARRIKDGAEDTQLAFYAALFDDDTLHAAYVNVGEKEGTKSHEQTEVVALRDLLVEGILDDVARIEGGAPLPALGEGAACEHCAARGLCRKDFW